MKLTIENIKKFRRKSNSGLTNYVCNYIIDKWDNYDDKENILLDVINLGCVSGIVTNLIYFKQTSAFYDFYKHEINNLLVETLDGCGCNSPADLFGKNWDDTDVLALEANNQNLLAWFSFEETMKNIANEFNIEW